MEHFTRWVKPQQRPSHYVHGTWTQGLWAGYLSEPSTAVNNVSGSWNQPVFNEANSPGDPSFWVGMTDKNSTVVQAGADSAANLVPGENNRHYEFWVEDYNANHPTGAVYQLAPYVQGGQQVFVYVVYGGSTSMAFLENEVSGAATTVTFSTPYYSGAYAAYVYEASGSIYSTGWGTVNFSDLTLGFANGGGAGFNYYPTTQVILQYGSFPWDYLTPSSINQSTGGFSLNNG
jgi:hypothetical protein